MKPVERILVLSNMYPSKHSKTFGIFVKNQVELLRAKGLQVDVIAIDDPRKGKAILLKKYALFFMRNLLNFIVRGRKYQAVHVHYIFPTGLVGLLYKNVLRKKLIVTSHGGDIDQMSKKSERVQKLTKQILDKSDHVITVGERLKEEVHTNFDISYQKLSVINMGVNRDVFKQQDKAAVRDELNIPSDERVLLFVGNLIRAKGLNDLVEAYEIISERESNTTLHFIGEPKDQAYFNELKEKTKNISSLYIHDAKDQMEVAKWLAASDLFMLPSHIEGFGLVALEAMACGVPVIGSDVGGLSYLLADEAGVKTEPHNPEDIAVKAIEVLNNKELQEKIVENGLIKADQFDQDKLIHSVTSLYKS